MDPNATIVFTKQELDSHDNKATFTIFSDDTIELRVEPPEQIHVYMIERKEMTIWQLIRGYLYLNHAATREINEVATALLAIVDTGDTNELMDEKKSFLN